MQMQENASIFLRFTSPEEKCLYFVLGTEEQAEQIFCKERKISNEKSVLLVPTKLPNEKFIDLTDERNITALKISREDLTEDDSFKGQVIGDILKNYGFKGIIAPVKDSEAKLIVYFVR